MLYTSDELDAVTDAQKAAASFKAPHLNGHTSRISERDGEGQPVLDDGPLPLHWRGQATYEEARVGRVFNRRRPDRYPAVVLKARNESDVIRGVLLANERNLKIAVRSGGHSWAALSVRDQSILIDLEHLHELSYNPKTQIVTASPSITGGELNPYLSQWGRFFAGGHCPTVGIGGFLLQGGQGWGARGWGWSCEQIASMDVVLPDGRVVTCSETENSDVFWCARGSGPGFFGIVLRFRLRTRPFMLAMRHTTLIIPSRGNFEACSNWFQQMTRTLDPDVECVLLSFARGRIFPESCKEPGVDPLEAILVVRGTALMDDPDRAERALSVFLQCPVIDQAVVKVICQPTSLAEEYAQQLADNPPGRYFVDNCWLHGNEEDITHSLLPAYGTMPSLQSFFLMYSMAPLRPLPDMAFDIQSELYCAGYIINPESDSEAKAGKPRESDDRCRKWLTTVFAGIDSRGAGSGGSLGQYTGDAEFFDRPSRIMSDSHWDRFVRLRSHYDPRGLFCGYPSNGKQPTNRPAWAST